MSDYTVFNNRGPTANVQQNVPGPSLVDDEIKVGNSDELKLSKALENGLNRFNIQYWLVAMHFGKRNTDLQLNMFELIMTFLNVYAHKYDTGAVQPGNRMYVMCKIAYKMLEACKDLSDVDPEPGRHRSE